METHNTGEEMIAFVEVDGVGVALFQSEAGLKLTVSGSKEFIKEIPFHQELQKAREEERERIKNILCGLSFKHQITHLFRGDLPEQEFSADIIQGKISDTIDHSELDQPKGVAQK